MAIDFLNKSYTSVLIETEDSIGNRRIGEFMTLTGKLIIYQLISKGCTIRISAEYWISESFIVRIIKIIDNPNAMNILQTKTEARKMLKSDMLKRTEKIFSKNDNSDNIRDIQIYTLELGVLVPRHLTTSFIKSSLRLSYKK